MWRTASGPRGRTGVVEGHGEIRLGRDYTATFWNKTVFDPFGTNGVATSGEFENFKGVIDLVEMRAIVWLDESLGAKFIAVEQQRWKAVVARAKIKPD